MQVIDYIRDLNPHVPHDSLQWKIINSECFVHNPARDHWGQFEKLSTHPCYYEQIRNQTTKISYMPSK